MVDRQFVPEKKPIQTRWFKVGRGYLCLGILRPPNFAITLEMRTSRGIREIAVSLISANVMYQWDRRTPA